LMTAVPELEHSPIVALRTSFSVTGPLALGTIKGPHPGNLEPTDWE